MAHWELHAWVLIMLAGLFVPFYYKSGVETIPQFGAIVFQALLPEVNLTIAGIYLDAFWIGAFTTVIITGLYTVFGGMRAIMATATPQAVIILFGSFVITAIGLARLGGDAGVVAGWGELITTAKGNSENFALWRPLSCFRRWSPACCPPASAA